MSIRIPRKNYCWRISCCADFEHHPAQICQSLVNLNQSAQIQAFGTFTKKRANEYRLALKASLKLAQPSMALRRCSSSPYADLSIHNKFESICTIERQLESLQKLAKTNIACADFHNRPAQIWQPMVNIDQFVQNEASDIPAKTVANESRLAQKTVAWTLSPRSWAHCFY